MSLQLGQIAPDFAQQSTSGEIRFHEWLGDSWGLLCSHPKNFTPVCATELGEVARLKPDFDRHNVKTIGLSVDVVDSHNRRADDIAETRGHALNFPLIADVDARVATLYDMIHPETDPTVTAGSVFVSDPTKNIRLASPIHTAQDVTSSKCSARSTVCT